MARFKEAMEDAMGVTDEKKLAQAAKAHFVAEFPLSTLGPQDIPIKMLVPSPTNPRTNLGDVGELVASIEKVGLLQPLLVRPMGEKYELVFGHRRLKAAKAAGLLVAPCDVRRLTDVQVLEAQVVENCQRLDIDPLDEAEAYERLQKAAGYTGDQIAARVGKSRAAVYARLKLNALGPEGRKALRAGLIHPSVAVPLARIPTHALQAKAVTHLTKGDEPLPANVAIAYLQDEFAQSLKGCAFNLKDELLVPEAGACSACPKNSATATPGLFEDLSSGAWCTDTKCYAEKARAHWDRKSEKAEAQGHSVMTLAEGRKLFKESDALTYGSAYVRADEPVNADAKRRTWAELVEKLKPELRPQVFVAPDGKLKAVELFKRAEAEKAIAEGLGLTWAEKAVEQVEVKAKRESPDVTAEAKLMREVRTRVRDEVIAMATAKATSPARRRAAFMCMASALAGDMDAGPYFEAKATTFEKWNEAANETEHIEFLFWAVMTRATEHVWEGYPEELVDVAKAFEIDLEVMTSVNMTSAKGEVKS